jgi:4'-phosphopantetheinyl transferase EntD
MMSARPTGAIETAGRSLFPVEVAVAVERIGASDEADLWPEEHAAILGAVPARLAEFSAGRSAARRVLVALGYVPAAVPMGADRAPLWPDGISGSIAHAAGIAIAVARRGLPIGIDVEEDAPLDRELWPVICGPAELAHLPSGDPGRGARHVFAAKEAVFKAQCPRRRAMFGFDAVSVTLAADGFDAQILANAGAYRAGQVIRGRLASIDGLVLAGVAA